MYINFWYPVCLADELSNEAPMRVQILGLRFAAFRDSSGDAHVVADTCVHRGGSLSKGKIINDNIACPYHGWQFDGTGKCAHIPVLGEGASLPPRAKVDSYPVVERYGIVFAFLGDQSEDERIPLYDIKEWDDPSWRASGLVIFEVNAYFERSIENGIDPAHNEFVHDLQGNVKFRPETVKVTTSEWGTDVSIKALPPEAGTTELENLRTDDTPDDFGATTSHYGPNTLITAINLSADNTFVQYFFEQPVDDHNTRIFFINMRNCMLEPENDERIQKINLAIADEDIRIIQELNPVRTPETSTKEILIAGDECIGAYRKQLKKWESRGWRIDLNTLQTKAGDVAHTIPSPARRTSKNWVLDEVPLISGAN
jgi:phenylpropionate dioxygenase-like ring-hydroxylating dioxygenase large terminal subunit